MKQKWLPFCLGFLVTILLLPSCESDPLLMNPDTQNKLFIWGCADLTTGIHRVRIREAVQEEGNVSEYAQDPNQTLPKDQLEVTLKIGGMFGNDTSILMEPKIYPKEEGTFSSEDNIIHECEYPIHPGQEVELEILNLNTGDTIRSERVTCQSSPIKYPILFFPDMMFAFTALENPFHIAFDVYPSLLHKMAVEVMYIDVLNSGEELHKKAIFSGGDIIVYSQQTFTKNFPLDYLRNILNQIIEPQDDLDYRYFYRFNFKSLTASNALREYVFYGEKFNDNRKLMFSNLEGAFGIFYASHSANSGAILPSPTFFTFLHSDPSLESLNFSRYEYQGVYMDPDSTNIIPQ